ncbi:hypothetical protein [Fischerella sp. JS2]|uniref:hypothetical protein n=1 Tax=Fischerella sp. JS2 TaxID=2597771 RepID=UPI0028E76DA1|nr:hypothetical protein [Fischerella sp. JS2]
MNKYFMLSVTTLTFTSQLLMGMPNALAQRPSILVSSVRSEGRPRIGQKHRSSGNFTTSSVPNGYRYFCWRVTSPGVANINNIRFKIKRDKSVWTDPTEFRNIGHGSKTAMKRKRSLYIADPTGAYDRYGNPESFVVYVYACN